MSQMNKKTITTTTSFRNLQASPEPMVTKFVSTSPVLSGSSVSSVTPMSQVSQVSAVPYAVNGAGYGTLRYLVPVQQQQQSFVLMQQPVMQQPVMQQVVSPMYLQNMQQLSISNQNDYMYQDLSTTEVRPMRAFIPDSPHSCYYLVSSKVQEILGGKPKKEYGLLTATKNEGFLRYIICNTHNNHPH